MGSSNSPRLSGTPLESASRAKITTLRRATSSPSRVGAARPQMARLRGDGNLDSVATFMSMRQKRRRRISVGEARRRSLPGKALEDGQLVFNETSGLLSASKTCAGTTSSKWEDLTTCSPRARPKA